MVGSVALNSLSLSSLRRKVRNCATPTSSFSASPPLLSPWRAQDSNLNPKLSRPAAAAEEAAIPTPGVRVLDGQKPVFPTTQSPLRRRIVRRRRSPPSTSFNTTPTPPNRFRNSTPKHRLRAPIPDTEPEPGPGPEISSTAPASTASKRWKDIFKKGEKKSEKNGEDKEKEKEKKKERKSGSGASSAELNINIWPFSRSRSAGNNAVRPRMAAGGAGTRKVSSAPCSRSNSAGESKSRKWPSSPGRPGVHLGRSSPVWQVRRGGSASRSLEPLVRNAEKGSKKEGSENRRNRTPAAAPPAGIPKARVLNLNVPMCIGYRHHLSCRSDENSTIGTSHTIGSRGGGAGASLGNGGGGSGNVGSASNLFNLRSLFTKKVY
ncbi:hypothetical protein AAG906_031162 [Vitis piasezkii]